MLRHSLAVAMAAAAMMFGCGENAISIGNPPPKPQFTIDQTDPNHPIFKLTLAEGFMFNWDFGNGKLSQDSVDTVYYPFADTYTVKLTVSNKGGATTNTQKLIIATTDPKICTNRFYTMLTGGCDTGAKTWKIYDGDSALCNGPPSSKDSLGNGTSSWNDPIGTYWWTSTLAGRGPGDGPAPPPLALANDYVFGLRGFTYLNDCHGYFYFNWMWANKLFGLNQAQYHDTIHAYKPNNPATWTLDVDTLTPEDSAHGKLRYFTDSATGKKFNLILTLSNSNYMGYCSGVSVYEILKMTPDVMYLRHELVDPTKPSATGPNRTEWRYLRLVAKK